MLERLCYHCYYYVQAAEAQQRVAAWQQHLQQQQADVQAALSIVQDHVRSSIQVCRLKLAQLQHWLTHPAAPRQQEALSRQLQEAERQLVQFRQGAHDCELEVQRVTQQQLSGEPMLDEATQASGSATAGTASPVSPSPNSNPGFDARNSDRQGSGNGTSPSRRSDAGWSDESVGAVSDHDQGTFRATGQGPASPALGAWASRGGSLWEGAGVASSSTATVTPSAPAATRLPPRYSTMAPWSSCCPTSNFHCLAKSADVRCNPKTRTLVLCSDAMSTLFLDSLGSNA